MKKTASKNDFSKNQNFKTKQELASQMGIHVNTLRNKLKQQGLAIPRGALSPRQVKEILDVLGWESE